MRCGIMLELGDTLPAIETERLRLRWMTSEDVPALFRIFSDPDVMRYWSSGPLKDRAAAEALLAEIHECFASRKLLQWGVAKKEDDQLIGTCTLLRIEHTHKRAEIGYALGSAEQGRGYAREAVGALINFAIDAFEIHRFEADIDPRNVRSIALVEALGFRREGFMPQRYRANDEVQDTVFYGLLAPSWREQKKRSDLSIRPMVLRDRDRVISLLAVQLEEHGIPIEREALSGAVDGVMHRPELGQFLVADRGAGPIGVAYLGFTWTLEHGGLVSWLEELYVVPEERNKGLGTALLEYGMEVAKKQGAKAMDLEVESDHLRAANLYLRHGFRALSRTRYQRPL